MIMVQFEKLRPDAFEPRNAYRGDAGWDLFAVEDTIVGAGALHWVSTGIAVALPEGYYGRIVGRSSAVTKGLHIFEGIIDSGYRGEQMARCRHMWGGVYEVKRGESIIQLIVQEVRPVTFEEVDELPSSERGLNGYGSSDNRHTV